MFQIVYIPIEEYLNPTKELNLNPELPIQDQTDCLSYDPRWEFPGDNLKFGENNLEIKAFPFTAHVRLGMETRSEDRVREDGVVID